MLMVGITGRSGSGKSSVARHYEALGYPCVDGDAVSRDVCGPGSPCVAQLAEAFGPDILDEAGNLQRRKLADIAFADPAKTRLLDEITHPFILEEMMNHYGRALQSGAALFFVEGAAILGTPFQQSCDRLIVVLAETRLSISRIILRDGISKTAAQRRLAAQVSEAALREAADHILTNNATPEALTEQADRVLAALLQEAQQQAK